MTCLPQHCGFVALTENPYTRTLRRALEHAGSLDDLARHLGVPVTLLQNWLKGVAPLPPEVYLKAIDMVARGPYWVGATDKRTYH
jgi:hypothetical protein